MTDPVLVRVLGTVGIDGSARELAPGLRRLLALLTVNRRQVLSTDTLVDHLWPDGAPGDDGTGALRTAVSRLRGEIGAAGVLTEPPGYRLGLGEDQIDAGRFEAHLVRIARAGDPSCEAELAAIDEALGLWRGGAWQEYAEEDWARGEAVRLEELRASATERRLELLEALGRSADAVAGAESFVAAHPYRERARAVLLRSLTALGRDADALRAFQSYRETMADAGLDPSAEMRALEAQVLAGEGRPTRPAPARPAAPADLPLDRRAASADALATGGFGFVGRHRERAALLDAVRDRSPVVLVSGEPGIGKTRLVQQAAEGMVDAGDLVLVGRCSEDLAAPYLPLSTALAALLERAPGLAAAVGDRGGDLVTLLLGSRRTSAAAVDELEVDAETERFRVLEAIRAWLTHLAHSGRVVLVVDDLHWVDSSTVAVLRDLLVRRPLPGVTVLGTYRRTEVATRSPLAALLADLDQHATGTRLALDGLSADDLGDLVTTAAGGEVGDGADVVAELLLDRSQGNPLFAGQILRHLVDGGAVALVDGVWTLAVAEAIGEVPHALRTVIAQRIGRLGPRCEALLDVAAVAGPTFDLRVVATVAEVAFTEAIDLADIAVGAGVLGEEAGRFGRYGFTHALVRDALVSHLSATRRAATSWALAEAVEAAAGGEAPERATELAHLYQEGIRAGDPAVAARWSVAAGTQAYESAAFFEALGHARDARSALHLVGEGEARLGVEAGALELRVLRRTGDPDVDRTATEVLDRAIELGDPDLVADIAAGEVGPLADSDPARPSAQPIALAERALAALPADAAAARVKVAAARAFWVHRANDPRGPELADEVVDLARGLDDPAILATAIATVLHAYQRSTLAADLDRRTDELQELTGRAGLDALRAPALWGRSFRVARAGDLEGWAATIADLEAEATRVGWATGVWTAALQRAVHHFASGRIAEAVGAVDGLAPLAVELGVSPAFAHVYASGARLSMQSELGQHREVADAVPSLAALAPALAPTYQVSACLAEAALGHLDEAGVLFEALQPDDFASLRFMALHELNLAQAAVAAGLLGRHLAADQLHRQLMPFAGRMIWTLTHLHGPVELALGRASIAAGELDRARRELDAAEAMSERSGLPGYRARARLHRAEVHRERGSIGAAGADATAALAEAEAIGHPEVAERSRALLAEL